MTTPRSSSNPRCPARWRVLYALTVMALGCQPQIGDDCGGPADCSQLGDRICDFTQNNGYCTQFNCEPGTCPPEAICIEFSKDLAPVNECIDEQQRPRTSRTFCMRRCEKTADCRVAEGYTCTPLRDLEPPNLWGARVLRGDDRQVHGICQTAFEDEEGVVPPADRNTAICSEDDYPTGGMSTDAGPASVSSDAGPSSTATGDAGPSDGGASDASTP